MQIDESIHREFIRVAAAYIGLGVFLVTAIIAVLSTIQVGPKRRPPIEITPPWFKKALLTSLILQIAVGGVLLWKDFVSVNTLSAAKTVTRGLDEIGILQYWRHSNDFLPDIRAAMEKAKGEIWISGSSFYLSVPDNENVLIDRATHGVAIHYLFLDPYAPSLPEVSRTFTQTPQELQQECLTTIRGLLRVRDKLSSAARSNLEIRLFDESPRARFYFFDPKDPRSTSFFVPHVNAVNSPQLPGFRLSNQRFGLAEVYFGSLTEFWNASLPLELWLQKHPEF